MNIDSVILVEAITAIVTITGSFTAVKVGFAGLRRRVAQLERDNRALPKNFVPRTEVELALKGIEGHVKWNNSMLQAMIYAGDNRHSIKAVEAQASPDFIQITIQGCDGKGGLNRWEGRVPYLYLDNRKIDGVEAPLMTVGVGCALDLAEALTLPFEVDSRPATLEEIAADVASVQSTPFGRAASFYARFTVCRLSEEAMDDLTRRRFTVFLCALRRLFPGYDGFPEKAKAGCLDLIYGLGVAGLSSPHYPAFRAAVNAADWTAAAAQSVSDTHIPAYDARNAARRELFLDAGRE